MKLTAIRNCDCGCGKPIIKDGIIICHVEKVIVNKLCITVCTGCEKKFKIKYKQKENGLIIKSVTPTKTKRIKAGTL